jgi:hypothetical protein
MSEIAETNDVVEPSVDNGQTGSALKEMMVSRGFKQKELVKLLQDRGISTSEATISRIMNGGRSPKEVLDGLHEILGEDTGHAPACPQPAEEEGAHKHEPSKRRATLRDFLHRRPLATAMLTFVVGGALVAVVFLFFQDATPSRSTPSPSGADQSGGAQVAECDQYEVATRDLWLRDQYGTPQIEFPHGEKVTVIRRASPYWEVTTESGQTGWMDYEHLKPLC